MNPSIARYISTEDCASDTENPAYLLWHQEDSLPFTWLLTTLSDSVLPRVVKCVHGHKVWSVIDQFQRTQIYVKSRQMHYELRCIEKGERTIAQYLGRIQQIVDIVESIGDPVRTETNWKRLWMVYLLSIKPWPLSFSIVINRVS